MQAPGFDLPDQNGQQHRLEDYKGKWLVLYFYLKDETSGCTSEACNFRDAKDALTRLDNVAVVGVSTDSVESHAEFAKHHNLTYTLLSDPSHKTIEAYGSWKRTLTNPIGTHRDTFIISPDGKMVREYRGVDPETHIDQIITDLEALQKP